MYFDDVIAAKRHIYILLYGKKAPMPEGISA
jgi:hypothetical protein